ncbi:MAG: Type 1 glutamine amidotransferase-like domain-containing protein [Sphingomonas sp.]|jgi:dipeptidase E|uniref:Type 1 glutamine amidotransferase-like domain-containing protein n=1 Tax=Sphingomonas sp. TaxID=28214 RepID=UPI0035675067
MKLLLTSSGITNPTIKGALVDLLGKPIAQSKALIVPAGVYPFRNGAYHAMNPIAGPRAATMAQLGWEAVGLLELTALPSIAPENWRADVEEADAILVWGGDPLFLAYWMAEAGLTELLTTLAKPPVYVGVSAGAIATASLFGEAYSELPGAAGRPLSTEEIILPDGDVKRTLVIAHGMGLTDFAIIPHFENPNHLDASSANAEVWAARLPVPVYAIDEETAVKVDNGIVEVVTEGRWKLFTPQKAD